MKRIFLCLALILLSGACQTMQSNAPSKDIQAPPGVVYEGGDGSDYDHAVVIKAPNEDIGVRAKYQWLAQKYPGYKRGRQSCTGHKDKTYDLLEITTAGGANKTVYFDISDFYGKFN